MIPQANSTAESDELLTVRFTGPSLNERSVPIYDFGETLLAIQGIIYKAALHKNARLEKGARLRAAEREQFALRIVSHRKSSDVWLLGSALTDPAYGPILHGLIVAALVAVGAYVKKAVLGTGEQAKNQVQEPPRMQVLIVNIFPEMRTLTNRFRNDNEIHGIELIDPKTPSESNPIITRETQDYVREIERQKVPGSRCRVVGQITNLEPQSFRVDLQDNSRHKIRINMPPELFEQVRRLASLHDDVGFEGVPLYKLAEISSKFDEFRADLLVFPERTH